MSCLFGIFYFLVDRGSYFQRPLEPVSDCVSYRNQYLSPELQRLSILKLEFGNQDSSLLGNRKLNLNS